MNKKRKTDNYLSLLRYRETYSRYQNLVQNECHFTDPLVKRLGLEHELTGHHGCVNCLEWSSDGRFLASGSDDTNVIYWDPFSKKELNVITTPHIGNIFSVKFLNSTNSVIATGAGDCKVVVQDVSASGSKSNGLLLCSCHKGRVKRLATCPDQPSVFWSAGEDGLIVQHDIRESHTCDPQNNILVNLGHFLEAKCVQVNPTNPNLIAVGASDCFVRMYDRRTIKLFHPKGSSTSIRNIGKVHVTPSDPNCVQYYAPGHLSRETSNNFLFKMATTYVSFNSAGTEMLVNLGGEQIYLFDVYKATPVSEFASPRTPSIQPLYMSCCDATNDDKESNNSNCLCGRLSKAEALVKRGWMGDTYEAARQYVSIIESYPLKSDGYLGLIQCFISLNWQKEAHDWMERVSDQFPDLIVTDKFRELETALKLHVLQDVTNITMSKREKNLRKGALDFSKRYLGHCNTSTDIKEVNFLGQEGKYLCAGSDEGVIFVWRKSDGKIITALWGDVSIVNCVQPHPRICSIASSGIDPVVKMWSPISEDEDRQNSRIVENLTSVIEDNQERMAVDPLETMLNSMSYRFSNHSQDFRYSPGNEPTDCLTS